MGRDPTESRLAHSIRRRTAGSNYRSVVAPDKVTPANRFAMRGYQCDIDGQRRYTGNN